MGCILVHLKAERMDRLRVINYVIMKNLILFLSTLFLANLLVSEENLSRDCFRVQDISSWRAVDNQSLIIWSPTQSKPYLVTLMNRCPGLLFEETLVFKSTLSRTCSNSRDTIYTEDIPCHIKSIKRINKEAAKEILAVSKALVLDVRTENEWNLGHLSSAKHIEWQDIAEKIRKERVKKTQRIYVYCGSGKRAEKAKNALEDLGYTNVINAGGLMEAKELLDREILKE